jgi:hypothetical protein
MTESTVSKAADEPARPPDGGALALEAARSARDSYRLDYDWRDRDVVRVPEEAVIELIRFLAAQVTARVQQIVPLAPPSIAAGRPAAGRTPTWGFGTDAATVTNFAQAVSRSLAVNREVERIYVVPPGGAPASEVSGQVAADQLARIRSSLLRFSDLRPPEESPRRPEAELTPAQQIPFGHVWIVDDSAVMFQEVTEAGPPNWTVSVRKDDVDQAKDLWADLKDRSRQVLDDEPDDRIDLTESMLASAELLARTAPMSCTQGNERWAACEWYHGSWQYLRLLNMVSCPQWHHDFYVQELRRSIDKMSVGRSPHDGGSGAPLRILISGAADYSMFAYVVRAMQDSGVAQDAAKVHVLDLCPTPLLACRWYSRHAGVRIITHELDICDRYAVDRKLTEHFDVITTDAFLTRFSPEDCKTVLKRWNQLLVPGGRVVTTVRLHGYDTPQRDDVQEIAAFVARVREEALTWRPVLRTGVDDICDSAREYARRITSTNLGGEAEIRALFESCGLKILDCTKQSDVMPGELRETQYLRIVAESDGRAAPRPDRGTRDRRRELTRRGDGHAER